MRGEDPIDGGVACAGAEQARQAGPTPDALTLSLTLPTGVPGTARLVASGALDRDGLSALVHLARVVVRRGDLVLDVSGLTDFPSALFMELRKLADVADRSRCRLRLDGLDTAINTAVNAATDTARRGDDVV